MQTVPKVGGAVSLSMMEIARRSEQIQSLASGVRITVGSLP